MGSVDLSDYNNKHIRPKEAELLDIAYVAKRFVTRVHLGLVLWTFFGMVGRRALSTGFRKGSSLQAILSVWPRRAASLSTT